MQFITFGTLTHPKGDSGPCCAYIIVYAQWARVIHYFHTRMTVSFQSIAFVLNIELYCLYVVEPYV